MMNKIGKKVMTPDGEGVIVGVDLAESNRAQRYMVELTTHKYSFTPCYWAGEIVYIS